MNTTAGSKTVKTSNYTNKDACRGAAAAGRMHLISIVVVGTQGINSNLPHGQLAGRGRSRERGSLVIYY